MYDPFDFAQGHSELIESMNIWIVAIVILVISLVLSFISLKSLNNKSHIKEAKKKLEKGRVLYQDTSSSSK